MQNLKILFFTKYDYTGPSSRYRIYQYFPLYKKNNFIVSSNSLLGDWYLKRNNSIFFFYFKVIASFFKRFYFILNAFRYDIVFIEYELFPYFPPVFEFIFKKFKIKFLLDYDDAIFLNYKLSNNLFIRKLLKKKIDKIISYSNFVITGSPYLTQYALAFNKNVYEIPTSLNPDFYRKKYTPDSNILTIGWIGSKSTSNNLILLLDVFRKLNQCIRYKLVLIGFDESLKSVFSNHSNVEFINWDSQSEIDEISRFDVGIMPLAYSQWNLGKCGFKLIQYMACSKPTISTPLPANVKINRDSNNFFANSDTEWLEAFISIYNNRFVFKSVGEKNYSIFREYYSIDKNVNLYLEIFNKVNNF
jgi:glycosyltransferase involved in cell wall biosynthesis